MVRTGPEMRREGAVVVLTPVLDLVSDPVLDLRDWDGAIADALADETCRALVIELCGDPSWELVDAGASATVEHARSVQAVCERLRRGGKPVIAAVDGSLVGAGFDLALSCHLILASESSRLGPGDAARGFGGLARLQRRAGSSRCAWLSLRDEPIEAQRLLELGVVEQVLDSGDCFPEALALAGRCASRSPALIEALLESTCVGDDLPLDDALELEAQLAGLSVARGGGS